ncbi:MAG TPA: translocation/assembly module TamB domain-containing protein [Gemmatimonadaceae bacterium]|nr:translocation/assembly module TamB domain-containing protein [Gemmatimonadaceae bacterium]
MSRRRVVAIFSAAVILLFGVIAAVVVASITQTSVGREWVRRNVTALINARLKGRGSIYIGPLSGGFLTQLVIDSVAIRDEEDSLFVSTGRVRLTYDPRDLIDMRLRIMSVDVEHPLFNLRRHDNRDWNFHRIFPPSPPKTRLTSERALGDYVMLDSVTVHNGSVILTMPWSPDAWLHGAQRDSAIRDALTSHEPEVRRTKEGLKQTWRWTGVDIESPYARLADPDSAGQHILVGSLRAKMVDPPMRAHNMRGDIRVVGDTAWFDLRHFDFPASTGHAKGTIRWGGDLPVRYAVHVVGDSVSLSDIDWVYPTLPTTGGGAMELDIHNDPRDLHVLEYALTKMDVRSKRSHLTGAMTFATGKQVLAVKDVALTASPVNFDLLRTLNGGPFPVDWQGNLTGTVRGPGGPLDRFQVSDMRFAFHDAHVPGAVSRGTAQGGIDIQYPARAVFHGFDVRLDTLDLRSVEYLFPDFPRLNGFISGSATLDSSWLDVRFRNADVTHHDGSGLPTHVTGQGRVTYGTKYLTFNVDVQADPLSFTTLAQSYPSLPFRGPYAGPLHVRGTMENLDVDGTLSGAAGTMSANAHVDLIAPDFAARLTGNVRALDVRTLVERPTVPSTELTGSFTSDLHGDSLANLSGTLSIAAERSRVDSTALLSSTARLSFGDGHLHVDSLVLVSDGARLNAAGALGLTPDITDTLHYSIALDALGALRPYMAANDAARDSLGGTMMVQGALTGSVRDMGTTGTFSGRDLESGASTVRALSGSYAFSGLPNQMHGTATVAIDTIATGRVRLASVDAALDVPNRDHGRLALNVVSDSSAVSGVYRAAGRMELERSGRALSVAVDTLGLTIGGSDHPWFLAAPAHLAVDSTNVALDSLVLRNGAGGVLAFSGYFPVTDPVRASFTADSVPLADLGALTQSETALGGYAAITASAAGTRANPTMRLDGRFSDALFGELHLPFFTIHGTYANRRLDAGAQVFRNGRSVLSATGVLPLDLALERVDDRMLTDPLTGRLSADSLDLGLLGAVSPEFTHARGLAQADLTIGGTWAHPTASGRLLVRDGESDLPRAGIHLRRTNADVTFVGDSITIRRFSAVSGSDNGDSLSVAGMIRVPDYAGLKDASFDLTMRARNFEAYDQRSVAKLQVSGGVQMSGTVDHATLGGAMTIDQGTVSVSDLGRKDIISLDESDIYDLIDTTFGQNRGIIPQVPPLLKEFMANLRVPDLRIGIGDDVWLRSDEANIKLGGSMDLAKVGGQRLSGTLRVVRGTYRLDLGIVRRTFQVDSGSIVFYGDPEISPALDIYATYVVRQLNRQDVHVIAHVYGTLAHPQLQFLSNEQFALSQTEILSYLAFGVPSFALGGPSSAALRPVASALLPTIGGVLEQKLSDIVGVLDYVQVQPGSMDDASTTQQNSLDFLWGSRIGVGKQIGERTFLTANYGLCKFGGTSNQSLADALGVTVERRLSNGFSVQASSEPASTALLCGRVDDRDTPRQFGFDLFREWSF